MAILVVRFGIERVYELSVMEERSVIDDELPRPHGRRQIVGDDFYN